MDPRRWEEVQIVFDELVDLDDGERQRRLAALGTIHPDIRDAVAALLRADDDVEERLKPVEAALLDPAEGTPQTVPDIYNLSGRTLLHFSVGEPLGSGGMGIVYGAKDLRLGRAVALKFLAPDLAGDPVSKNRFLREARAMAALDHPNVCAIHEVAETDEGVPFFAMPLYAGETLQARLRRVPVLAVADASHIARQIAEGLASAHNAGTVHRDLKPGNVMLLPDGSVKILDFGVAKACDQTSSLSGSLVGTIAYMSPEQLRGETVDARTDLWSLGVVLLEMVTGTRPVPGVSPFHRSDEGSSAEPCVPANLRDVLERLLQEGVADRYQTAAQVVEALTQPRKRSWRDGAAPRVWIGSVVRPRQRRLVAAALAVAAAGGSLWSLKPPGLQSGGIASILVLPFENLTGGLQQDYFVAGLHDAFLSELGRLSALRTISRTSAIQSKASGKSLAQVARELDVDAVVEGSALRSGDSIRLNLRLVDPSGERQLWAQAFDGELSDILTLLKGATLTIAQEARVPLTAAERAGLARARSVDPVAHEMYLRGLYHAESFTPDGLAKGVALLREATRRDPGDPLPYTALARIHAYGAVGHSNAIARRASFAEARTMAIKALELDETSADAHAALGAIHLFHDWDWAKAERELRRAITLDPNSANARWAHALYLTAMLRFDEAIGENLRAQQLDPLSKIIIGDVAVRYYVAGQYDAAISWARRALDLEPDFPPALWALGVALREKGSYSEAIRAHELAAAGNAAFKTQLAITYAKAGRPAAARQILGEMDDGAKRRAAFDVAQIHVMLGEREEGLRWLEIAYDEHHPWLHWVRFEPALATLRSEPRYQAILRRMRLPER